MLVRIRRAMPGMSAFPMTKPAHLGRRFELTVNEKKKGRKKEKKQIKKKKESEN